MVIDREIRSFNCLRCGKEVKDGEEGIFELGLCFNCIELEEEEGK